MRKIQEYLDNGYGECWLSDERVAQVVVNAIQYFDGIRYASHVCCIMPNHLHWLLTPIRKGNSNEESSDLSSIMHSIKSFTANQANKLLKRTGAFWSREYYDHKVRDDEEFGRILTYIINNPVNAGFCKEWTDWKWTLCSKTISEALTSG